LSLSLILEPAVDFLKQFNHGWDHLIESPPSMTSLKVLRPNDEVLQQFRLIPEPVEVICEESVSLNTIVPSSTHTVNQDNIIQLKAQSTASTEQSLVKKDLKLFHETLQLERSFKNFDKGLCCFV